MKKIFIFLLFFAVAFSSYSQDMIVTTDGDVIKSKVLEVNKSDIRYKKYSNLNGPVYTLEKLNILSIVYENGEKDVFNKLKKSGNPRTEENIPQDTPFEFTSFDGLMDDELDDNRLFINDYVDRSMVSYEKCDRYVKWDVSTIVPLQSSQMSTKDVDLHYYIDNYSWREGGRIALKSNLIFVLVNKSDNYIYVNLEECIFNKNTTQNCLLEEAKKSYQKKNSINIDDIIYYLGLNGTAYSVSYGIVISDINVIRESTSPNIIAIPPKSSYLMPPVQIYKDFGYSIHDKNIKQGFFNVCDEPSSIDKCKYSFKFNYSNSDKLYNKRTLSVGLYPNKEIGVRIISGKDFPDKTFKFSSKRPVYMINRIKN